MPNPNTSFATATDIGTLTGTTATTVTQDAWNGSTTDDLYFSYLPITGDDVLEVYGAGDLVHNRFATTLWYGPAGSPTQLGSAADNTPIQRDIVTGVTAGQRIFIKCHPSVSSNPSVLTLRVARGQLQPLAAGDLFINDSADPFPGVAMSATTAIPKRYVLHFPAGEGLQILTNGTMAVQDDTNVLYKIYTSQFALSATVTNPFTPFASFDCLSTNHTTTFWGGDGGGGGAHAKIFSFDATGTVGTTIDLGSSGLGTTSPNSGNTKVYFVKDQVATNEPVRVVDTGSSVISTFIAGVVGKAISANLLMMTDNTLLVPYQAAGVDTIIKRYNESGTLLNTYTLTGIKNTLERIFADKDDPTYFWVWVQPSTSNQFMKIQVSDGTVVTNISRIKFVAGLSQEGAVASTSVYSGADFSCVPIMLRTDYPATVRSGGRGIYVPTRGVSGSEGGGSNARFADLNGYPSTSTGFSTTTGGRIIPVLAGAEGRRAVAQPGGAGSGRAIYVPTTGVGGAEGDGRISTLAQLAIRRIVVYDGEGYTHR